MFIQTSEIDGSLRISSPAEADELAEKIGMSFEKEGKDEIGPFLLYSKNQ